MVVVKGREKTHVQGKQEGNRVFGEKNRALTFSLFLPGLKLVLHVDFRRSTELGTKRNV